MHKFSVGYSRSFDHLMSDSVTSVPPVSLSVTHSADENHHEPNKPVANPLLATLLDSNSPAMSVADVQSVSANIVNESPMLSKLLEENISVASNPFPAPSPNPRKRLVKRKSSKDVIAGKSPKQRISDSEMADRTLERVGSERHGQGIGEKHIDLDSSGGSYDEPGRPSSVNSVGSIGGLSSSSVIDLTDIGIGESHVKKLENSLDSIMGKESSHGMMGLGNHPMNNQLSAMDFDLNFGLNFPDFPAGSTQNTVLDGGGEFQPPPPWGSRQTPPTPNSRSSPHPAVVPKNEKTSTSLEESFPGPRGREIDGPSSAARRNSTQKRLTLKQQQRHNRHSVESGSGGVSPDGFSPLMTTPSPSHHPLASPGAYPMSSPNYIVSPGSLSLMSPSHQNMTSPVLTSPGIPQVKSEPFNLDNVRLGALGPHTAAMRPSQSFGHVASAGKPSLSMLKAQLEQKNDIRCNSSAITQDKDELSNGSSNSTGSQTPSVKLKLNVNHKFDSVSPTGSDGGKSRSSTFDFHSDDEDCDLPRVGKMTIVSASPTRLQISNKSTPVSFNKFNKSEKFKRKQQEKELKTTLSVDSGKRKREREDKKEKKRKKMNSSFTDEGYKLTTVKVENNSSDQSKPVMPKLKITKKGVKISVENSLNATPKIEKMDDVRSTSLKELLANDEKPQVNRIEKDVVVKVEKLNRKSDHVRVEKKERVKERSTDKPCAPITRTPSNSEEGIFDRINAMKSENLPKNEDSNSSFKSVTDSPKTPSTQNHKKNSSSKSAKSHKRSSSASNADSKMKTPTIKLKPIAFPSSTSSSVTIPRTPGTPTTPKAIVQSPTSTTIGKIGAVSLATSGSQKSMSNSTSKSPQGSSGSSNKTLSRSSSSGGLTSKSSSSLQKNIQIQGPSGKNSPIPQSSSSKSTSHARSASVSSSGSKADKLNKSLSSSNRTSSPQQDKEKSKSRSSSTSSRDREKSTSSKSSVPVTTVTTQETAASVLSFLNPKANKIASFTIPKLKPESNPAAPKVSTPTTTQPAFVTSAASTVTTTTTNSNPKLSKGVVNSSANNVNSASNRGVNSNAGGANVHKSANSGSANNSNSKNSSSYNNKVGQNSTRPQNLNVANTANANNRGSNSPNSFNQKGSHSGFKGNNNAGLKNHGSINSSFQNKQAPSSNGPNHSNWNKQNHQSANQNKFERSSSKNVSEGGHNRSASPSTKGSNMTPNAPKGPGPPVLKNNKQVDSHSSNSSNSSKPNSAQTAGGRGRKGSLSAVIDKLTCMVSGPPGPQAGTTQKVEQVIVNESPASPEMDTPAVDTRAEKVVVITEAPESPEMETPTSPVIDTLPGGNAKIVSIPLETDTVAGNSSDFSAQAAGVVAGDIESPTAETSPTLYVPKTIPLDSVGETVTKDVKSVNAHTPVTLQNGDIGSYSSDNDRHSKLEHTKDSKFKVPSVKSQDNGECKNTDDIENQDSGVRRRFRCASKSSEASSPPSSPENGLIIDIEHSPTKLLQNRTNSPCKVDSGSDTKTPPGFTKSPGVKTTPLKNIASPSNSPINRENSISSGSNANSPGFLEDDLMDEALGIGS